MLPPPQKKVICKSSIIPEASSVPNGSIEGKLKSLGKFPNTAPPKKNSVLLKVWRKYLNLGL